MNALLVLVALLLGCGVLGRHNITTFYSDPSIVYSGIWTPGSDLTNSIACGGAHTDSSDSSATATWQFTGVAFYYMAPQWAYPVNTIINIDNGNITTNIDLDDHALPQTGPGLAESIHCSVLWGSGELENGQHTVVASMPQGGPPSIVVDAFMYTVLDPGDVPPVAITTAETSATTVTSATTTEKETPTTTETSIASATSAAAVSSATTTEKETPTTTETSISSATSAAAVSSATTKSSLSVGLVVGGIVVPAVIAAAFVAILLCRCYRRKRQTQQVNAGYYNETSSPVVRQVQPSWTPQDSTCLMCRMRPKNNGFDFCGPSCRDGARNQAPLVLEVPQGHTTFTMVEHKFQQSWKANTPCPQVKNVYRIILDSTSVESYDSYLWAHGNESFRYHGTERTCAIGQDGCTTLCMSPSCKACSIIRTSFELSLSNPGGAFGQGIYTSSATNKSARYTHSGIMFLTKVVLGNIKTVSRFAEVIGCPPGYQSVVFDRYGGNWNETVVYTNDAIRPVFMIAFG